MLSCLLIARKFVACTLSESVTSLSVRNEEHISGRESMKGVSLVKNYLFKDITFYHIFQCI